MNKEVEIDWSAIRSKAGPYPREAFQFVREGLSHTVRFVYGSPQDPHTPPGEERHVSGQQLCMGLRDYALQRYGMLARTVLMRWGIRRTEDFGRIVYAMIDGGLMRRSDRDAFEDFQGVYDFDEAFTIDAH